jgi:hypothetical protein
MLQTLHQRLRNPFGGSAIARRVESGRTQMLSWVPMLILCIGPLLLLGCYEAVMFSGLTDADALDFAQLGRNASAGRGLVTYILRPLAMTYGTDPLRQPDVTHGPLYPFLLALAFGALGARDSVVAGLSGLFYLLTIPILFRLGVRIFDRSVAWITVLIFGVNALLLEYAASGLPITLTVFLATSLFATVYDLAMHARDEATAGSVRPPRGPLALAGLLTGLLYLTDPLFVWTIPVLLATVLWLYPSRRWAAALGFLLPLGVLALPWMWRNGIVTGNPIFGLTGVELWMNTGVSNPDVNPYRLMPDSFAPGVQMLPAVMRKMLLGLNAFIRTVPQITGWALAFFLPGLLFRLTDSAANVLRKVAIFFFLALLFGMLLFHMQMDMTMSVFPTLLLFAVAHLRHLVNQAGLRRSSITLLAVLLAVAAALPLVCDMAWKDRTPALWEAIPARALGRWMQSDEVSLSDQPWILAWYTDRPSVWIPAGDADIRDIRQRFVKTRWLFLTEQARNYSPAWSAIAEAFQRWNLACVQARQHKQPLPAALHITGTEPAILRALEGFTSVEPVENVSPSVVMAVAPPVRKER